MKVLARYDAQNLRTQLITGIDFLQSEETGKIYAIMIAEGKQHLIENPITVKQLAKHAVKEYIQR